MTPFHAGNSAIAAIDLLVNKGVDQSHIIFLTLIAAPQGIFRVCEKYPQLVVVTSEIDAGLSPNHVVLPGIGEFGDRYFGTDCSGYNVPIQPGERASKSLTPREAPSERRDEACAATPPGHAAEPAEAAAGAG